MLRQPRRLQIDLAFCDLVRKRAIEFAERTLHAEQLRQPRGFRGIAALLQRQLPRHQIERVDGDPQLEGVVAVDLRRDVVAQEIRDRLDQFGRCRFVLHLSCSLSLVGANSRNRSISVSDERRPIIARSIE